MGDTTEALEFGWQLVCGAIQLNSEQEWCEWMPLVEIILMA